MPDTPHSFPAPEADNRELRLPGGYALSWDQAALVLLALATLFRFWYCTRLELVGDEAYYWLWSRHLDLSYFSKGPGVAYTIAAGTHLFGNTVFGIRFFAVLLSAGTGYALYRLGKTLFDSRTGFYAMLLAGLVWMFSIGSLLMTIDPLSVFFWTLAAWTFWKAKDEDGPRFWLLTGLWIGLGMLCKYTNIAELICFALFCLWSREHRRHLCGKTFWLMLAVALLCLTPVVLWNQHYGWITLHHLQHRGALDKHFEIVTARLLSFLLGQTLVISPFIFTGIIAAAFSCLAPAKLPQLDLRLRYLLCLFFPLVLFYCILSLNETGQANWTCPAYISGLILTAVVWNQWNRRSQTLRRISLAGLSFTALVVVILHLFPLIPAQHPGLDQTLKTLPKGDRLVRLLNGGLNRVRGSASLAEKINLLQKEYGASFIIANKYSSASLIAFYHPEKPQTYLPTHEGVENQFSFWPGYNDGFQAESAIYVTDSTDEQVPDPLPHEFSSVVFIGKNGKFKFYFCHNYGGPRPDPVASPNPPVTP